MNVKQKVFEGSTLLHSACMSYSGNLEVVKYLVEHGVDINAIQNSEGEHTALSWSISHQHLEIFKYLISKGADINFKSELGTLLHRASCFGQLEMIQILVEKGKGLNINAKDYAGKTPLQVALERKKTEKDEYKNENYNGVIDYLRSKGAK